MLKLLILKGYDWLPKTVYVWFTKSVAINYITQTANKIYEKTSGRIPLICASNHVNVYKSLSLQGQVKQRCNPTVPQYKHMVP